MKPLPGFSQHGQIAFFRLMAHGAADQPGADAALLLRFLQSCQHGIDRLSLRQPFPDRSPRGKTGLEVDHVLSVCPDGKVVSAFFKVFFLLYVLKGQVEPVKVVFEG